MKKVHITMIHDVVCSWCPIGYRNLSRAIEVVSEEVQAGVNFLPFELNPRMAGTGEGITEHLMHRTGMTRVQVLASRENLLAKGKEAGVNFNFSNRTHYYNSFNAHCLMHYAETQGKQSALNEVLIEAYFSQGVDISNIDSLITLCDQVGLNKSDARTGLESGQWASAVREKQRRVERLELGSVPAFIVNGEHLVSGSNSVDFFVRYLQRVEGLEQPAEMIDCQHSAF